jgi:hypothetical protein
MKLDHPRDACFKHCAGGFGTRDTPTLDERSSRGPISLHNAIGPFSPNWLQQFKRWSWQLRRIYQAYGAHSVSS